jgi:hypothetical protein
MDFGKRHNLTKVWKWMEDEITTSNTNLPRIDYTTQPKSINSINLLV